MVAIGDDQGCDGGRLTKATAGWNGEIIRTGSNIQIQPARLRGIISTTERYRGQDTGGICLDLGISSNRKSGGL